MAWQHVFVPPAAVGSNNYVLLCAATAARRCAKKSSTTMSRPLQSQKSQSQSQVPQSGQKPITTYGREVMALLPAHNAQILDVRPVKREETPVLANPSH
jgi:hypothetical protein